MITLNLSSSMIMSIPTSWDDLDDKMTVNTVTVYLPIDAAAATAVTERSTAFIPESS